MPGILTDELWEPYTLVVLPGDGANTDRIIDPLTAAEVAAGSRLEILDMYVSLTTGTTTLDVRIGFGATTTPALGASAAAVRGLIFHRAGMAAPEYLPAIPGRGRLTAGATQRLRLTTSAAVVGGQLIISYLGHIRRGR